MPFYHVSAADGTNVVRLFRDAIRLAHAYRKGDPVDFLDQLMHELEVSDRDAITVKIFNFHCLLIPSL